ncbi:Cthe_2314 family HEPN domain-containing protein [Halalkalibacter nanhaiisediminis]|uniref:Cthe-2314-like HEPN domain-containing protein n=1 Tax=Halalkalibacter nanhaiisediminis TaxID=688079 RepID=A0A562QK17_9BACI|nr:Cthe_2314 family HEPN domain-containing protein [Halalkalibacter nanhaiisediminis]TWI57055.1 hypothetical protein IQ10_01757 [Halalkalibacter nanhaiisediminis]
MDIYDYAKYPAKEDWQEICKEKASAFEKLGFEPPTTQDTLLDLFGYDNGVELKYWVREYNNRAFDLTQNYTLLKSYFDAGIPDDEWYISPGKNGASISYFPHFEERHFANLYWFGFYMESFFTRAEGLIDTVYHLVNVKFNLGVEPKLGFRKKVLNELETVDKDLFDYLNDLPQNIKFKKMNEYRNNLVHNFRPSQIDSGIGNPEKQADGSVIRTLSVGNYTTSTEFLNIIHETIDLLVEVTDEIRNKVEQN